MSRKAGNTDDGALEDGKNESDILAEERIPETDLANGIIGWEGQDDPQCARYEEQWSCSAPATYTFGAQEFLNRQKMVSSWFRKPDVVHKVGTSPSAHLRFLTRVKARSLLRCLHQVFNLWTKICMTTPRY